MDKGPGTGSSLLSPLDELEELGLALRLDAAAGGGGGASSSLDDLEELLDELAAGSWRGDCAAWICCTSLLLFSSNLTCRVAAFASDS